jgi:hypothetical protein
MSLVLEVIMLFVLCGGALAGGALLAEACRR